MPRHSRSRSPPPRPSSYRRSPPPHQQQPPARESSRPSASSRDYTAQDRERERERDRARYEERNGSGGGRAGDRGGDRGYGGREDGRRGDDRRRSRSRSPGGRGGGGPVMEDRPPPPKPVEPNFEASGALAAETNMTASGAVLKYNEPPEARKPTLNWRLYVFKGKEQVELFQIHRQSAYLAGRDSAIVDIPLGHPSCSKQHAVLQFRLIKTRNAYGDESSGVKPFLIDLDSTNGCSVNGAEIPPSRYYELKASDVIKFGQSSREYVLLHEEAA